MGTNVSNGKRARRWEHFPHIADVGVRGYGETMGEAFEQAALAMTAIVSDLKRIRARKCVAVELEAPDSEYLLVDWLNAVVFEMATRRMLFSRFEVRISGCSLDGRMFGETVDTGRHRPAAEVKGVTLSELHVEQFQEGQWLAQCIVDV